MIRRKIAFAAATLAAGLLTVLLLLYEPYTSEAVRGTLALFVNRVLPPLFPYMVLSKVMVSFDLLAPLSRFLAVGRLFRLPERASAVVLTGLLCGFPVGAAGTCTLYESGGISKEGAGRLAALSSNAGPAFLLGTVAALWNSKAYGGFLFAVQTVSALVIAFIAARSAPAEPEPAKVGSAAPERTFPEELCRAVSESASACLAVCAYIVFFRVMAVVMSRLIPAFAPVFGVLFEFSSGCADGAAAGGIRGMFMTGFAVGSGGLSVMMQNYNFIGRHGIPVKALWAAKGLQGFVCGTASALFYLVHPLESAGTAAVFAGAFSRNAVTAVLSALFVLSKIHKISKHVI